MTGLKRLFGVALVLIICLASLPIHAATPKEWTVAVFINGDNNLDSCVDGDQLELAKVGSNNWLNMVTLVDRFRGPATMNFIERDEVKPIADWGEIDMGDYQQLVRFMKYVVAHFPAKKYCLIIWNHGSGWKDGRRPIYKGISYDQTSGSEISNTDLRIALKEIKTMVGHNIDILGMDACLMQMVEVAFVCKDSCDYIIASEEEAPGNGVPYDQVFLGLGENSSTEEFVKFWVKAYVDSYSGGSQGTKVCTQSAIKCSAFPKLLDGLDGFAKASMASGFNEHFSIAHKSAQRFMGQRNIDLVHFVKGIKEADPDSAVQNACDKLLAAYDETLIATGKTGDSVADSFGLAIYFPWDFHFDKAYDKLPFCDSSLWDDMIHDYYHKDAARNMVRALENSDLEPLENYSRQIRAGEAPNQYVVPLVNFRLYSETGIPAVVKARAQNLCLTMPGIEFHLTRK